MTKKLEEAREYKEWAESHPHWEEQIKYYVKAISTYEQAIEAEKKQAVKDFSNKINRIFIDAPMNMYPCDNHSSDEECSVCGNGYISLENDYKNSTELIKKIKEILLKEV